MQTTLQTSQQCTERLGGFKCASALDCSCPSLPRVLKHEVAAPCVLPDGHTTTGDLCGIGGIQPARAVPNQPSRHLRPCSLVSSALFSLSRGTGAEGEQELAAEPALLGLPRARSQAAGEGKTRLCFGGCARRLTLEKLGSGFQLLSQALLVQKSRGSTEEIRWCYSLLAPTRQTSCIQGWRERQQLD